MKLVCECGNLFDFGSPKTEGSHKGKVSNFGFKIDKNKNDKYYALIKCEKCGICIALANSERKDDDEIDKFAPVI